METNGFSRTSVNSELIWKKGGTFMGGQCIKVEFSETHLVIQAWVTPFLGRVDEHTVDGIGAIIPRKQIMSVIEKIKWELTGNI